MSNVAIITARGGSKRIPRKNIRDFLGKPIIAYSIQVALESKLFDEIMVSTDDKEIAEYLIRAAGSYGLNRYILALETENKSFYNVFKQFGFAEVDNKLSIQLKVLFKKCENC